MQAYQILFLNFHDAYDLKNSFQIQNEINFTELIGKHGYRVKIDTCLLNEEKVT